MNKNKFLEQYQKLRDPKAGDVIQVIRVLNGLKKPVDHWSYKIGDTAVVENYEEESNACNVTLDITGICVGMYREEFIIIKFRDEQ